MRSHITILPSRALGRAGFLSPNDKANIAFIGIGNFGGAALNELSPVDGVDRGGQGRKAVIGDVGLWLTAHAGLPSGRHRDSE